MTIKLTRRDFAIRTAGFGLALGLAPTATLAGQLARPRTVTIKSNTGDTMMTSVLRSSGTLRMLLRDEFLTPLRYYK